MSEQAARPRVIEPDQAKWGEWPIGELSTEEGDYDVYRDPRTNEFLIQGYVGGDDLVLAPKPEESE